MAKTSSKSKEDSTKKRSRNDLGEDDQGDVDDFKETKRLNTSKTPVKRTGLPLSDNKDSSSIAAATILATTNPKTAGRKLQITEEISETLAPPPAHVVQLFPTETATPTPGSPEKTKIIAETTDGDEHHFVEVKDESVFPEWSSGKWAKLFFFLVFCLAITTGGLVYSRLSSQLILGELRQDVLNCKSLQSHDKLQDEYYIRELETQVRGWKQEAKSKVVELEALRMECQD